MRYINHNLMAVNSANTLAGHYSRLSTSVQRLSSGLRINSAADDAAGLAIRELMRSDISTLRQGVRNANDAISMLQVADGALAIIDEKLIRMKELAEQAATGTYNSTQRLMIDSEFQAMGSEIDRIARATDFNGMKLLDGSLSGAHDGSGLVSKGAMKIHFGTANDSAEDYYYVEIDDCTTLGLGLINKEPKPLDGSCSWLKDATIDHSTQPPRLELTVSGGHAGVGESGFVAGLDYYALPTGLKNVVITSNAQTGDNPYHKAHVCLFDKAGVQYTGPPIMETHWSPYTGSGTLTGFTSSWWNSLNPGTFLELGKKEGLFNQDVTALTLSQGHGAMTTYIPPGGSHQSITAFNGATLTTTTGVSELGTEWSATHNQGNLPTDEVYQIDELTEDVLFFIGGHENPADGCNMYNLSITADITPEFISGLYLPGVMSQVNTQEKAQKTLVTVNDAIIKKDKVRAQLGALQNRFENTVTNLTIQAENLEASESRISDADVAGEMTEFVRNQVLTNAATAMLGQANAYPQMLAQLLNG